MRKEFTVTPKCQPCCSTSKRKSEILSHQKRPGIYNDVGALTKPSVLKLKGNERFFFWKMQEINRSFNLACTINGT